MWLCNSSCRGPEESEKGQSSKDLKWGLGSRAKSTNGSVMFYWEILFFLVSKRVHMIEPLPSLRGLLVARLDFQ